MTVSVVGDNEKELRRKFYAKLTAMGLELNQRLQGIEQKPIEERVIVKIDAIQYRLQVAMNLGTLDQRESLLDLLQQVFILYNMAIETPVDPHGTLDQN